MSGESKEVREGFLSRWSRLKAEQPTAAPPAAASPIAHEEKASGDGEAPVLPNVEELTIDSDFRGFLDPKVDENVRRAAMRKLFSDPHFNVMDGLDVYIEDYSKTEPIPAAMLASLTQAKRILRWAEGKDEEVEGEAGEVEASIEDKPPSEETALPDTPDTKST